MSRLSRRTITIITAWVLFWTAFALVGSYAVAHGAGTVYKYQDARTAIQLGGERLADDLARPGAHTPRVTLTHCRPTHNGARCAVRTGGFVFTGHSQLANRQGDYWYWMTRLHHAAAHAADVGPWSPWPSKTQVEFARINTRERTINKCVSEQLYRIINGRRVRVGKCFDPGVLFCVRGRSPRRVVCPAIFHIRTRHGVYVWHKVYVWRVRPPVFGFLWPREVGGPWIVQYYGRP